LNYSTVHIVADITNLEKDRIIS